MEKMDSLNKFWRQIKPVWTSDKDVKWTAGFLTWVTESLVKTLKEREYSKRSQWKRKDKNSPSIPLERPVNYISDSDKQETG